MNRRSFIKTSGITGLGSVCNLAPFSIKSTFSQENPQSGFAKRRTDRMLFPRPLDGSRVSISPPGFAWLPCTEAAGYRLEIRDSGGNRVYEKIG